MKATEPTKSHLEKRTSAHWKPGDTGLVKTCPGGHIYIGAHAAEKLGMVAGQDSWEAFTVVPDEQDEPMNLAVFLEARISEDEAAIERRGEFPHSSHRFDAYGAFSPQCPDCLGLAGKQRVLAECQSKRTILGLWQAAAEDGEDDSTNEIASGLIIALREVLQVLAAVYSDHPDYQQEWVIGG